MISMLLRAAPAARGPSMLSAALVLRAGGARRGLLAACAGRWYDRSAGNNRTAAPAAVRSAGCLRTAWTTTCSSFARPRGASTRPYATSSPSSSAAGSSSSGSIDFLLADIGEGISEVELLRWFVHPGQSVKQFDKICEVQSDKANVEISSRYDGVISSLCYKEGEIAKVGAPLVKIDVGAAAGQDAKAAAAPADAHAAQAAPAPAAGGRQAAAAAAERVIVPQEAAPRPLATPAVRQYARERGVSLAAVRARDGSGRVSREDIDAHLAAPPAPAGAAPAWAPAPAAAAGAGPGRGRTEELRGAGRAMVKTMTASNAIPHFGLCDEVDCGALAALRDRANAAPELAPAAPGGGPLKLTFTPFFVKSLSLALARQPLLNASIDVGRMEVTYHADHNIAVAVDTPQGLVVPVVRGVQALSVWEVAAELARLQRLARENRLAPADLAGATVTLSNIGALGGGLHAAPLITPPQVAIVALGAMRVLPRFEGPAGGPVRPARVLPVSWAADHRLVDGAALARAAAAFRAALEEPALAALALR